MDKNRIIFPVENKLITENYSAAYPFMAYHALLLLKFSLCD